MTYSIKTHYCLGSHKPLSGIKMYGNTCAFTIVTELWDMNK